MRSMSRGKLILFIGLMGSLREPRAQCTLSSEGHPEPMKVAACQSIGQSFAKSGKLLEEQSFRLSECFPIHRCQKRGTCYAHSGLHVLESALFRAKLIKNGEFVPTVYAVAANLEYEKNPSFDRAFLEKRYGPGGLNMARENFAQRHKAAFPKNSKVSDNSISAITGNGNPHAAILKALEEGRVQVATGSNGLADKEDALAELYCTDNPSKTCQLPSDKYKTTVDKMLRKSLANFSMREIKVSGLKLDRKILQTDAEQEKLRDARHRIQFKNCGPRTDELLRNLMPYLCLGIPVGLNLNALTILKSNNRPGEDPLKPVGADARHSTTAIGVKNIQLPSGQSVPSLILDDSMNSGEEAYLPLATAGCAVTDFFTVLNPGDYGYEEAALQPEKKRNLPSGPPIKLPRGH
jgi:hypothetical protein